MEAIDLLTLINGGETSRVQFKEDVTNGVSIAQEMVAFANAMGGTIIVGVKDKTGEIAGLNYAALQRINNLLSTSANDLVKPSLQLYTESVQIDNKYVLIVTIPEGIYKPYRDKDGSVWIKKGSDKRKVTSNEEEARLLQSGSLLYADEMGVRNSSLNDLNSDVLSEYFLKQFGKSAAEFGIDVVQLYRNMHLLSDDNLTLAGVLLFGKNPQMFRPVFVIKAVYFVGNAISGTEYRDSQDISGTIGEMFAQSLSFVTRNIKYTQQGRGFNSVGMPEIPLIVFEELIQNALIHRDYLKSSPIRLLIFDNRIEIISPGKLPNSLSVESIKLGNAVSRNPLLASFASRMLPYRGLGSGIIRSMQAYPNIDFFNDTEGEQFTVTIKRPSE